MFGTWGEILVIAIATLLLIGPKEMPEVLRTFGRWLQKFRAFRQGLDQQVQKYIHEGEFEEYRRQANNLVEKTGSKRLRSSRKPKE